MAVLISGTHGQCDAKCYDAKHSNCTCICGGKNHGVGEQQAVKNTQDYCEEMIKDYCIKHDLKRDDFTITPLVKQFSLF